jgi:hypothetical protein
MLPFKYRFNFPLPQKFKFINGDFLIQWCLRISDLGFYAVIIIHLLMAENAGLGKYNEAHGILLKSSDFQF